MVPTRGSDLYRSSSKDFLVKPDLVYLYMCIYIYICVCMCVFIYDSLPVMSKVQALPLVSWLGFGEKAMEVKHVPEDN